MKQTRLTWAFAALEPPNSQPMSIGADADASDDPRSPPPRLRARCLERRSQPCAQGQRAVPPTQVTDRRCAAGRFHVGGACFRRAPQTSRAAASKCASLPPKWRRAAPRVRGAGTAPLDAGACTYIKVQLSTRKYLQRRADEPRHRDVIATAAPGLSSTTQTGVVRTGYRRKELLQ